MNLNDIRRILALILGKRAEEVRELSPANFSALLHYNSLRYFHRRTGIPEEYQVGMPILRETAELVRANSVSLLPFIQVRGDADGHPVIHINEYGYGSYPDDFYFPLVVSYVATNPTRVVPIEIYSNADFIRKKDDVLEKATTKYPMCTFHSKIQIAPTSIRRISMTYLRLPVTPYFAFKYENGINVYDAENSVELEWNDIAIHQIIGLMCESLGVSIGALDVAQYQKQLNDQGR